MWTTIHHGQVISLYKPDIFNVKLNVNLKIKSRTIHYIFAGLTLFRVLFLIWNIKLHLPLFFFKDFQYAHSYLKACCFAAKTSGSFHVTTLDGFIYTFNGVGEFVYLKTIDETFQSHIRLEQFLKENGLYVWVFHRGFVPIANISIILRRVTIAR